MKTGFTNAFVNVQVNKSFKYHGMNDICDKPPDPGSFKVVDMPEIHAEWVLWKNEAIPPAIDYYISNPYYEFLFGPEPNICYELPGVQWYYVKIKFCDLVGAPPWYPRYIQYGNGWDCNISSIWPPLGVCTDYEWLGKNFWGWAYMFGLHCLKNPSHITIWRSDTGPCPPGIPSL